jgi:hypothetical protein
MRTGPAIGQQCEKTALPGSDFCQSCSQKKEVVQPDPNVPQCLYIFIRGQNKGTRCPKSAEVGITLCTLHKLNRNAQHLLQQVPVHPQPPPEKKEFVPPSEYRLRFKAVRDSSALRESQTLTDITLVVDGVGFPAHKLVLFTASPYFAPFFISSFKERDKDSITLNEVSSKTFQLYIDLIYGKEVTLKDWKEAFDLFDYFKQTLLSWSKDDAVTAFWVQPGDYVDYIQRLEELYEGEVPEETIKATCKYITPEIDFSQFADLDEKFLELVRPRLNPSKSTYPAGYLLPEVATFWS